MTLAHPVSQWRSIQKENFVHLKPLLDFLELTLDQRKNIRFDSDFVLNLPKRLASKIEKGTLNDPILLQFVPLKLEEEVTKGFTRHPVQDDLFRPETRYLQKYKGRALLLLTSACAMHCRYCFRQNLDYGTTFDFSKELALIEQETSLHEVILSGGDPLSLGDQKLKVLLDQIERIPHITKVRFHTRFPIGIPERLDSNFLDLLKNRRYKIYFVFHINHAKELDKEVIAAVSNLQKLGVITLNQAVLLKGVNDNYETQKELHLALVDHGILPYYLHQLDRVEGAAHFEVSPDKGRQIIQYLRSHLPGYAVPSYVQEIPKEPCKTPL